MGRRERKVAKINSRYMEQYDAHVQRQRKKKSRLRRRLTLFAIIVGVTFASVLTYHISQRVVYAQKQEQLETLEEQATALTNTEKDLEEEIKLLEDEEYVLQIAKTNYFFTEEGEIVFKLPQEDPAY
ncbi:MULTISPECIES: septum formation initiator family protein [Paraliobacillus]|uniref:FtsB family cell division protein n=1 Tax=Paraliobacillus TaxID=200903 RepID=UPI000DD36D2C|nr:MULTISPECIES: septum formation initiator family protein [Paraliobacillus]